MKSKKVIIIGSGYGGMALANICGKAGYKVDVYEKNSKPGGRIAVQKHDGYTFDIGPSWYLMPEVFEDYYKLFNETASKRLDLIRFKPGYKVFFEGESPVIIQGNVDEDKTSFEKIEPGAGKRLEEYVSLSSRAYKLAVKYFLYNNFSRLRDVINFVVIRNAPAMFKLVTRNLDSYVSSKFRDLRLKQLLEYHMVFLGSSPFQAPALYTLMSHLDFKSGVYYPRQGMISLVEDMLDLSGWYDVSYHFSSPVREIIIKDSKAVGVRLADGSEQYADMVVSNADIHFTENSLLPEASRSFPESYWAKRQPGPGSLLISLGIEGQLPELIHHNLYFVKNWRQNFDDIYVNQKVPAHASVYICNPTKTDKSLAPEGHENVFVLIPIPAGVKLSTKEQDVIAQRIIKTISLAIKVPDLEDRITTQNIFGPKDFANQFNAWQYNAFGGESHLLSQSVIFRTPNKSRRVKNLYYVGAGTVPGIGLPMCLISAALTYKKMTNNNKPGSLTSDDL